MSFVRVRAHACSVREMLPPTKDLYDMRGAGGRREVERNPEKLRSEEKMKTWEWENRETRGHNARVRGSVRVHEQGEGGWKWDVPKTMAWEGILLRRFWGNLSQGNLPEKCACEQGMTIKREREIQNPVFCQQQYTPAVNSSTPTRDASWEKLEKSCN